MGRNFAILCLLISDLDVAERVNELRETVCPAGRQCISGLSDQVVGSYVQQAQKHPFSAFNMNRLIWMETILRTTEIVKDDLGLLVYISNACVCVGCFAKLCTLTLSFHIYGSAAA